MTAEERHVVPAGAGTLALVLHLPDAGRPAPCIVACHGLSASKDSDKYLLLGAEFPRAGLALARFDFRGCGESSGKEEDTTIASRIEDVEVVLAHLANHPALCGSFGLLGSSLGGFVALFVARARDLPVVTWNAPATLAGLARVDREDTSGIGAPFLQEFERGDYAQAPKGVARHLVIHGEADTVVELEHGIELHGQAAEPGDLRVIAGGDHRLTDLPHRREAVEASRTWLLRFLSETP